MNTKDRQRKIKWLIWSIKWILLLTARQTSHLGWISDFVPVLQTFQPNGCGKQPGPPMESGLQHLIIYTLAMIFRKPSMEGEPVLVWEISQSPCRGPQSCSGRAWGERRVGQQKGGQLALLCEQACHQHFCIKIVGLGNPKLFLQDTVSCFVLKYLLYYKFHTFVIYNLLSDMYHLNYSYLLLSIPYCPETKT